MKIYTEVNYKWIDGSLVQTSSESFDYTGDLTLCGGGGGGGGKGGGGGGGGRREEEEEEEPHFFGKTRRPGRMVPV